MKKLAEVPLATAARQERPSHSPEHGHSRGIPSRIDGAIAVQCSARVDLAAASMVVGHPPNRVQRGQYARPLPGPGAHVSAMKRAFQNALVRHNRPAASPPGSAASGARAWFGHRCPKLGLGAGRGCGGLSGCRARCRGAAAGPWPASGGFLWRCHLTNGISNSSYWPPTVLPASKSTRKTKYQKVVGRNRLTGHSTADMDGYGHNGLSRRRAGPQRVAGRGGKRRYEAPQPR